MKNERKNGKLICIILSIIVIIFSLTGDVVYSNEGSVSLIYFESFYIFICAIIISLYNAFKNKQSNISTIIALLTYPYTFYLVYEMIKYITDIKISVAPGFYIYLSSSIFLIISLFLDNDKKTLNNQNLEHNIEKQMIKYNNLNKNNFIFAKFIFGTKEIPYNTTVLLVNNISSNSIDLIYSLNNIEQTKKIPFNTIKNLSYTNKVKLSNISQEAEDNKTKSILLSAVMFGGNPIMQSIGNNGFNILFDSISNNYDKTNFNLEYEIVIEFIINNQENKFILTSQTSPEVFINQVLNK